MRISLRATTNWASTPRIKPKPTRPMTTDEFKAICQHLKITDNGTASELLGPSWRSCQRYHYGELPVPPALARLLRLAAACDATHAQLRQLAKPIVL